MINRSIKIYSPIWLEYYLVLSPSSPPSFAFSAPVLESYRLFGLVFPTETPFLTALLRKLEIVHTPSADPWLQKQIVLDPQLNSTSRLQRISQNVQNQPGSK
jgi:hypothetical protein